MTEVNSRSRARKDFYLLTLLFLIAQALFMTDVEVVGNGDILGAILLSCLFLIFIALTITGYIWAKWILTTLLLTFGTLLLFAGFEVPSLNLKIVGVYYYVFGLMPHFSARLKPITISRINKLHSQQAPIEEEAIHTHHFPYLLSRYKAILIDGLLLLTILTACILINGQLGFSSTWIFVVYLTLALSYEPILITYSSTIGQKIMKLRVRNINNPDKRISLGQAYIRFFTKALLGWLSFLTISFNKEKRAIHDFVASSVVITLIEE